LIAVAPDNAEVHNNLGVIHFKKREYSKAKTYFETALTLDASYDEAHANLNHVRRERVYDLIKRWGVPVAIILVGFAIVKVIGKRRKTTARRQL
jgi:tetratricopeptide (TPR) repeat protein